MKLVDNQYTDLNATISCKDWSTTPITLKIGVYQDDPLSAEIFNAVMNTFVDSIQPHLAYSPTQISPLDYFSMQMTFALYLMVLLVVSGFYLKLKHGYSGLA